VYAVAPVIAESDSEVTVTAGQSAVLHCEVSGDPQPQVTWTKNGVRLSSDSDPHYFITEAGSLEIFSVHPDDTATYSCTAINVAGVREKRLMLFVHGEKLQQYFMYIAEYRMLSDHWSVSLSVSLSVCPAVSPIRTCSTTKES